MLGAEQVVADRRPAPLQAGDPGVEVRQLGGERGGDLSRARLARVALLGLLEVEQDLDQPGRQARPDHQCHPLRTDDVVLVARLLGALAAGLLWATVNAHTAAIVTERLLARATAVVIAGATLGTVIGVPAANLAARSADWRAAFVVALVSLLAAAAVRLVVIASPDDDTGPRSRRQVPGARPGGATSARSAGIAGGAPPSAGALGAVLVVAGFTGLVLIGHFAAHTFVTVLLGDAAGALPGGMSGALALFGAAAASAVVLVGRYGDRRPQVLLVVTAVVIALSLLATMAAGAHSALAVAVVVLWGVSSGALPPLAQTMIMRLAGARHRGTAGAIVPVMFNLGIALGAAGGAAVIAGPGLTHLPVPAAVIVLLGAAGLAGVARRGTSNSSPVLAKDHDEPAR